MLLVKSLAWSLMRPSYGWSHVWAIIQNNISRLIGAFVYQGASMLLQKLKVDDPVDASPVHGFCGIWGCMAVALFDWGKGFDHYHAWSGWGCMPVSTTDSTCKTGINGSGLGANCIMVLLSEINERRPIRSNIGRNRKSDEAFNRCTQPLYISNSILRFFGPDLKD